MNTIATTIYDQLGGNKFRVMTGAKEFVTTYYCLKFKLPRGAAKNKATSVSIRLTSNDLYTVVFYKAGSLTPVSEFKDVYNDQLVSIFEEETGLYCSL